MIQLKTRWADAAMEGPVHPEYPRPQMVRDSFLNLNGMWEYCINQEMRAERYDGTIRVPFSPETLLSGVQRTVTPKDFLHYKKTFMLPEGFWSGASADCASRRVLLHFGAVDQECIVWMNGKKVGTHKGGYLAFSFDVTSALRAGENVLTVCVRDMTEAKPHARGKQKLVNEGKLRSLFYTPQSGIWKTVWMESVPEQYIEHVKITPLYDEAAIRIHVRTNGEEAATIRVMDGGQTIAEVCADVNTDTVIPLGGFRPWSPEDPYLYDVTVICGADKVQTYFGMRKVHVGRDRHGILRFFLNDRPYFFNGILDQGYWPESLMTPPTDEALRYDIEKLKDLGFNTIRKHIKIESDRFYYHCDRIGMLVWQDMPNGGGEINSLFATYMPNVSDWFARHVKDSHYWLFGRTDAEGRAQYYRDLSGMIRQLEGHPSIAVWVPFNEGWGQFDAAKATSLIRRMDHTRLVNEACGWFDQRGGDMYSIHNYFKRLRVKPQKDRVVALTEFGGYAYPVPGHLACEKEFGYQKYKSKEDLTANYRRLWNRDVFPNLTRGLSAAIYTQTSDIEEEINGIFTYDRDEVKFVENELRAINTELERRWQEMWE